MPHGYDRRNMNKTDVDNHLIRMRFGHLATVDGEGNPYVVPVDYKYVDGVIYFHGADRGQKIENIRRHPNVCFEVSSVDPPDSMFRLQSRAGGRLWKCVIVRGKVEKVIDETERARVFSGGRAGVYKIKPEMITGRATYRKT